MLPPEIAAFVAAAKRILGTNDPLEDQKFALAEQLAVLSRRDDLTRSLRPHPTPGGVRLP